MIGRTLLHYEIVEKLGQGGMGEVYRAVDKKLGRDVALKILPQDMASDPERLQRFEREARAIAALKHPNIVTLHSIEEAEGVRFITMEYVEGGTLSQVIPQNGLALEQFFDLAIPMADALARAHSKGIAHRDLKPANVMLDADGRPKILDFGLAKLFESRDETDATLANDSTTGEGQIVGTVAYMSPEQAEGLKVDARSDVFSLGILLYEMATGQRPFSGKTTISTLSAILKEDPPSVTELRPICPRHLGRIIARCLAKSPDRRYQNALDVRNELDGLRVEITSGDLELPAGAARAHGGPPTQAKRLNRGVVGAIAAVVLVTVVVAAIMMNRSPGDSATSVMPPASSEQASPEVSTADDWSVAVLPFANMSTSEENEYFADGLSEELMNMLARIPDLRVAARTSSFHYKGHTGDMREIGQKLNVAYVLEGSVRRAGDRIKVTAQLVKASDGFHVWSKTYERTLDDIFGIQEEIATEVANAMQITLIGTDQERLAERVTLNIVAYEAYLKGRSLMAKRHSETLEEAERLFRRAIELDPDFAKAYADLAQTIYHQADYGTLNEDEAIAQAMPLVEKALELDPDLSEAYAIRGLMNPDFRKGLADLEKAVELDDNNPTAHMWYALRLGGVDLAKRDVHNDKAIELDPLAPVPNANKGFWIMAEDPDGAEQIFLKIVEFAPEFGAAYEGLARINTQRYDYDKAISYLQKGVEVDPRSVNNRIALADVQIEMHEWDRAEATLLEALEIDPGHARTYGQLSGLHRRRGRFDEALRYTMKALERDPTDRGAMMNACMGYLNLDDVESARKWSRRVEGDQRSEFGGLISQLQLAVYDQNRDEIRRFAIEIGEVMPRFFPGRRVFVHTMDGNYDAARTVLEMSTPHIFRGDFKPAVGNRWNATLACFVLKAQAQTGELERRIADLEALVASVPEEVRVDAFQMDIVHIHLLRGQIDEALDAYEVAVANGRINRWWDQENFRGEAFKNEPRFGRIIEGIRADVAEQRAALAAEGLANP